MTPNDEFENKTLRVTMSSRLVYEPNNFYFYLMCALIVLCFVLLIAVVFLVLKFLKYKKKLKKYLTLNLYANDVKNENDEMNLGKVSGFFGRTDNNLNEDLLFEKEKF